MAPSALADTELVAEEPAEILALEAMEMTDPEEKEKYNCTITGTLSGTVSIYVVTIEVDAECTGSGESTESAKEACRMAMAAVDACIEMWEERFL